MFAAQKFSGNRTPSALSRTLFLGSGHSFPFHASEARTPAQAAAARLIRAAPRGRPRNAGPKMRGPKCGRGGAASRPGGAKSTGEGDHLLSGHSRYLNSAYIRRQRTAFRFTPLFFFTPTPKGRLRTSHPHSYSHPHSHPRPKSVFTPLPTSHPHSHPPHTIALVSGCDCAILSSEGRRAAGKMRLTIAPRPSHTHCTRASHTTTPQHYHALPDGARS